MKNLPLLLLGLICSVFATTVSAQTPEQARNFQIDATHKGSITIENFAPPLKQRWTVNFGRPMSYPLIADGRVFVTVRNNPLSTGTTLYALDASNGATIWSFNLGGPAALVPRVTKTAAYLHLITPGCCDRLMLRQVMWL